MGIKGKFASFSKQVQVMMAANKECMHMWISPLTVMVALHTNSGSIAFILLYHNNNNTNNDNNEHISRAPFHVKHAQLR